MAQPGEIVSILIMTVFLLIFICLFLYIMRYTFISSSDSYYSPLNSKVKSKKNKVKNANLSLHI